MTILIGTDEAGYGPNLGPLVIAATAWNVPDDFDEVDLYDAWADVVSRFVTDGRIAIADSKQLFKQGGSLVNLELGVHAALAMFESPATSWREMFTLLDDSAKETLSTVPWYCDYDERVPIDLSAEALNSSTGRWKDALNATGISLVALRVAVVFPSQFNLRVAELGSKGALLTERTLQLVREALSNCPAGDAKVQCDKHGGRNRYAAALQHIWPESWIEICEEGRANSAYQLRVNDRNVGISFSVGGESALPAALASMTAKYLRELAMRAFNAFWQQQIPNLRPTAGYPVDARRFRSDIAAVQTRLQIDDDHLWRCR